MSNHQMGAVASECPYVSETAIKILRAGGNAVDAAIAAMAVQGVTRPFSGGIGGDGFMHIYMAERDEFIVLDHRGLASRHFDDQSFVDREEDELYPRCVRASSGMATAVPGAVMTWDLALADYGTMGFEEVLQPAIDLAERGFKVDRNLIREIRENEARFKLFSSTRDLYFTETGEIPQEGDLIRNPDFANTYRILAKEGVQAFYEGEIAESMVEAVQHPPVVEEPDYQAVHPDWKGEVLAGVLTMEDFRDYTVVKRQPVHMNYRGYDVYAPPPVSSGGVILGQILGLLEPCSLGDMPRWQGIHYFLEACRLAYADRSKYMGDPDLTAMPLEQLLDKKYLEARHQLIDRERAAQERAKPGLIEGYESNQVESEARTEGPSTIHLSVKDSNHNIVAYTNTIVSIGGNGMVVPGRGFILNNALAGLTRDLSGPNYPRPRTRPLSSMSPTIVLKNKQPRLVLGSPGGATIITTIAQVLINYIDFGMSLKEALVAPRLSQKNEASLATDFEGIFKDRYGEVYGTGVLEKLQALGHLLEDCQLIQGIGCVNALEIREDGQTIAVSERDRRGSGIALTEGSLDRDAYSWWAQTK